MSGIKTALDLVPEKIQGLLQDYEKDLDQAWVKMEKGDLTISFSATFGIKQGQNNCEVTMSFTKEKIKDKANFTWDDKQESLFKTKKK